MCVAAAYEKGSSFQRVRDIGFKVYDATGGGSQQVADIWKLEVINQTGKIKQGDEQALMRFAAGR